MLKIFSLFSLEKLQTRLKLVNHKWKRLVDDESLYRTFKVKHNFPTPTLGNLIQKYGNVIKYLHLYQRSDISKLAPFIKQCVILETLKLTLCFGKNIIILDVITECKHLNTVIIENSPPINNISEIFVSLSQSSVKKIHLRSVENRITTSNLSCLKDIDSLTLKFLYVNLSGVLHFCKNNFETLTVLKLITLCDFNPFDDYLVNNTLLKVIGSCKQLRILCLGGELTSKMDDTGLLYLLQLNYLTSLVLRQADRISVRGFINFFEHPLLKNLKKLGLYKCPSVTNDILKIIAIFCPNLEKFSYEQCKGMKSEDDLDSVFVLIQNCKKLKELSLFCINISVSDILHIIPEYLPSLKYLKYSNDDDPMKFPSFLNHLNNLMPDFNVYGMQWKYNLYIRCIHHRHEKKKSCRKFHL